MRFLIPATTSPGRALLGCGPSVPAAVPPTGFLTPSAVSWQARARGGVSRRCRPWDLPRPEPSPRAQHVHPSRGRCCPRRWSPERLVRRPFPGSPGFPRRPRSSWPALMGADPNTVAWFPPGLVRPFPRDLAVTLPRRLRARPPDSPGDLQLPRPRSLAPCANPFTLDAGFPSPRGRCSPRGAPLQSLRPVLCSGPSCPARSPRACARASRRPGSLTRIVGGGPSLAMLREVHDDRRTHLGGHRRASSTTVPPLGGSP